MNFGKVGIRFAEQLITSHKRKLRFEHSYCHHLHISLPGLVCVIQYAVASVEAYSLSFAHVFEKWTIVHYEKVSSKAQFYFLFCPKSLLSFVIVL